MHNNTSQGKTMLEGEGNTKGNKSTLPHNQKKTRKYLLKPNDTATRELLNLMGETERKHSIPTYHIGDLLMKLPTKRVTNAFKKANKKSSRSIINALYKELCDIKQYNIMIEEQQIIIIISCSS